MTLPSPSFDRLGPALRRMGARVRAGHVLALSVVFAAGFGLVGLRAADLPGPRPIADHERLRIEVVQPVEPEIVAGSVMDVGELVDGFQGVPRPMPRYTDVAWSYDDGWNEDDGGFVSSGADARRATEARAYYSQPEAEPPAPVRAVKRWFGFDEPRRDYQAERAARRARIDAMERHERERRAAERFRRERAQDERYAYEQRAAERDWRERAAEDRYARESRRDEGRDAPSWREDRSEYSRPARPDRGDPRAGWEQEERRRAMNQDRDPRREPQRWEPIPYDPGPAWAEVRP